MNSVFGVKSKNMQTTPTTSTINIQDYLRLPLKIVRGCKDYREDEEPLKNVDDILKLSGLERIFIELSTKDFKGVRHLKVRCRVGAITELI